MSRTRDLIYLASPYTVGGVESELARTLMEARFRSAMKHSAELQKDGNFCISPIAHWHRPASLFSLPKKADFWLEYNFNVLERCDELNILMLPGWEESTGVSHERAFAHRQDIPVDFIEPTSNELERQSRLLKEWKK